MHMQPFCRPLYASAAFFSPALRKTFRPLGQAFGGHARLSVNIHCHKSSSWLYCRRKWPATECFRPYSSLRPSKDGSKSDAKTDVNSNDLLRENIYTIPNAITMTRIIACPLLGWSILHGNFSVATGLLAYAGISDLADGYLARKLKMHSVLGTILDPAADKILMTTLTITLAMKNLLPLPLAIIVIGRDVLLSLSALYIRYKTLPQPKNFYRYWNFSIPSAEVHPTRISKINTTLQLLLMGFTTVSPLIENTIDIPLHALQLIVAVTTIWSGLSYVYSSSAVRVISNGVNKR